jgi:WD40 repeat protein
VFDHRPLRTDSDILALAFAPDGTLWSIEEVGMLRHWDLQEQRQLGWHTLSDMESLWTFSRDASILASATDELSFWDVATGHLQGVLPQASWVTALTLSGRGTLAATGHEDGTICLWDPLNDNQLLTLRGHICQVSALAFSADNSRLASAGEDKIVHLWDTRTGQECGILEGPCDRIPALVWHPQGHRLYAAGWDTSVWVWDTASGQPVILLNSHASQILAIAISSDGRHLACADSAPMIHVWDLANNRECCVFSGLEGETRSLVFSTDGQTLVSGGSDRVLHVWDYRRASEGNRAESRPASEVDVSSKPSVEVRTGLALMADGQRLASIYPGKGIRIWDTATREPLCDLGETGELGCQRENQPWYPSLGRPHGAG